MIRHAAIAIAISAVMSSSGVAEPIRHLALDNTEAEPMARVIVKYKEGVMTSQGTAGVGGARVLEVPESETAAVVQQLRNRQEVEDVAVDVLVTNPPLPHKPVVGPLMYSTGYTPSNAPTDPGFSQQISWLEPTEAHRGYQNTLDAYLSTARERKVRVGVLDSGFYETPELVWQDGYNLSGVGDSEYGPEYYENVLNPGCNDPHGNGVAAIIGAVANNGAGVAGITDAELVAARVLACGSGSLYDAAVGIRWLAGDSTITGVPTISEPVQIMNASLGATVSECPFYLQEAINFAYERGVLIVVAAGNENMDASNISPANCQHVVAVGALEKTGAVAGFSNFGDQVDISALGSLVGSIGMDATPTSWYGTSFSSPIVAGIGAMMYQANPLMTPDLIANLLVSTARPSVDSSKDVGGIADASKALAAVRAQLNTSRPEIRPALNGVARCNEQAYVSNAPSGVDFTSLYEVTASHIPRDAGTEYYAIFKTNASGGKELLELTSEEIFILDGVDLERDEVWFDVCDQNAANCRFGKSQPISQ